MIDDKGQRFLQYVGQNQERLKRNLRKNITYNPELFEDVFAETIIKVYDSIMKNDIEIIDFEKFFFIASKFNYIQKQNKERKITGRRTGIEDCRNLEIEEYEDEEETAEDKLREVSRWVEENLNRCDANIFWTYHKLKAEGTINAEDLTCRQCGISRAALRKMIRNIHDCLTDPQIKNILF